MDENILSELSKLKEVLKFYAKESTYEFIQMHQDAPNLTWSRPIDLDLGDRAREVINQSSSERGYKQTSSENSGGQNDPR